MVLLEGLRSAPTPLPAPVPVWCVEVTEDEWIAAARGAATAGGRLVTLWGSAADTLSVCAAYVVHAGLIWVELPLPASAPVYPDLASIFPAAVRMQRAAADLLGIQASGSVDQRPWLRHGAWPADYMPLHPATGVCEAGDSIDYPFVKVAGEGVHEIPVGPVHAGIIEPGHFRFSVVGEKVLRLEERLGYTHKGIEKRFTQLPPLGAHRLAGRVSGDSTVAYAFAYCMALESACGCEIPERAAWLRALLLELERVANHLGDLGALGNDAGLAFGLAQFSRLREDWLRRLGEGFGHRLLMDRIVPGGVAVDPGGPTTMRLSRHCDDLEGELRVLRDIYEGHAGLQDRFIAAGRVTPALAGRLGLTGLAGRASGIAIDLRCDHPWLPYDRLAPRMATHRNGDVAARVTVRFEEAQESLRLIREILGRLPDGAIRGDPQLPRGKVRGLGWMEGWRGEVMVALELAFK